MMQSDRLIETINAGDARIFGLEASWEQDLGTLWHASTGATITDGKLVHDETGLQPEDRRLPVVPTYTLRGGLQRDIALGHVLDGRLEAHATLGEIEAMLAIDNLFACSDDTFAYGNRLRIFDAEQFTPLHPTSLTLSLGWHF